MKIFLILFFTFVLISCLELTCFMFFGSIIGLPLTLLIILGTGTLGAYLAKREGLVAWHKIKLAFRNGGNISKEVINGLCLLLAGIALIIPGFVTDIIGMTILIPFVRQAMVSFISKRFPECNFLNIFFGSPFTSGDNSNELDDSDNARPYEHTDTNSDVIDIEVTDNSDNSNA